jgi:hypothetical protein
MKRKYYTATLASDDGAILATATKYAMNSAIRETEALLREIARGEGTYYHGGKPERVEQVYTRRWVSDAGRVLTAQAAFAS